MQSGAIGSNQEQSRALACREELAAHLTSNREQSRAIKCDQHAITCREELAAHLTSELGRGGRRLEDDDRRVE